MRTVISRNRKLNVPDNWNIRHISGLEWVPMMGQKQYPTPRKPGSPGSLIGEWWFNRTRGNRHRTTCRFLAYRKARNSHIREASYKFQQYVMHAGPKGFLP